MAAMHNYGHFRKSNNKIILSTPDTFRFIQYFKEQESLWNTNDYRHNNKVARSQSLQEIARKMNNNWTEHQVREKILSLRSRYSKELVKVRLSISVGSETYTPVWRFFPLLDSFLRPFCVTRKLDSEAVRHFHRRLIMGKTTGPDTSPGSTLHPVCLSPTTSPQPHDQSSLLLPSKCQTVGNNSSITTRNENIKLDDSDDLQIISDEEMKESSRPDIAEVYLDNDKDAASNSASGLPGIFAGSVLVTQVDSDEPFQTQQQHQRATTYSPKESSGIEQPAQTGARNQVRYGNENLQVDDDMTVASVRGKAEQSDSGITEVPEVPSSGIKSAMCRYRDEEHHMQGSDALQPCQGSPAHHSVAKPSFERQKHANIHSPPPPPLPSRHAFPHSQREVQKHRCTSQDTSINSPPWSSVLNGEIQNLRGVNGLAKHVPSKRLPLLGNGSCAGSMGSDPFQQQMLQVMQILLTSVKDQFSNEHADADIAFANHIACELKKLDEDLKTDVKFTIQKAIYDVQKQMNARKQQQQ